AGHVKRAAILCGEFKAFPFPESRGTLPHVHQHVENRAGGAADELDLWFRVGLEVHPANHAAALCEREVALWPAGVEAVRGEFLLAICPRQEPALVFAQFQLDEPESVQRRTGEFHSPQTTFTLGI